jgi:hypothetical protein
MSYLWKIFWLKNLRRKSETRNFGHDFQCVREFELSYEGLDFIFLFSNFSNLFKTLIFKARILQKVNAKCYGSTFCRDIIKSIWNSFHNRTNKNEALNFNIKNAELLKIESHLNGFFKHCFLNDILLRWILCISLKWLEYV